MNKCILIGRMVRDIELRQMPNGDAVCEFSIAVTRSYNREKTDFIGCKAFKKTAEFISKYFHKGDMIAIIGSIETDEWTDKEGKKQHKTKISVESAEFAGSKRENTEHKNETDPFSDFETFDEGEAFLPFE